ncbi:hypothetical protein AAC387_Pa11g2199 [Persea americana]
MEMPEDGDPGEEDKNALERLNKSKEAAPVEAEKILKSAMERALIVEEVQNQNFELKRQIEICQEENRIFDKTNRQKVAERQMSELNEEKRTLERELARAKVSANRVASVVANEWKDDNDKVIPVKQWLEEKRRSQGCQLTEEEEEKGTTLRSALEDDFEEEEEKEEEDTALVGLDAAANEKDYYRGRSPARERDHHRKRDSHRQYS